MTIEQIQRSLAVAAEERTAPPTRVTVEHVYRAGVRRRRAHRWASFAAVTVTAVGVAGGVAGWRPGPDPSPGAGPHEGSAASTGSPTSGDGPGADRKGYRRTCAELAAAVAAAAKAALPAGIGWGDEEFPGGNAGEDCPTGGIFWVSFTTAGQTRRLAFDGGTGRPGSACAPVRRPVVCEHIDGGEVGHLPAGDEYGVLLSRDRGGVYFFLGIAGGGTTQPLTTAQLSVAAQRVAADVFG